MTLLILYVVIALLFSFLCSVAEAVLLSVTQAHISLLAQENRPAGQRLAALKADIDKPLAAILTLNTMAHTVGAVGAGAEATSVFGSTYVGVFSALLTLAILVLSEIIPKTLGAVYWRQLAGVTAHLLVWLIRLLYPFVKMAEWVTRGLHARHELAGFSREEFAAMADLGQTEGQLAEQESRILKNLFRLSETRVTDAMTPRPVIFSVPESLTVSAFVHKYQDQRFSRVPVYADEREHVTGFVLKDDLLVAQLRGNGATPLANYRRELPALAKTTTLAGAFDAMLHLHAHMVMVVDEYGGLEGILTMEDILETLLGLEIVDESDRTQDMQRLARRLWRKRAREMGLPLETLETPGRGATADDER